MLQFNQMNHNFARPETREDEKLTLFSCHRRASEFEKRFCFDLTFKEKPGLVYTFQALSEKDHCYWLSAMDGTEPVSKHKSLQVFFKLYTIVEGNIFFKCSESRGRRFSFPYVIVPKRA